MGLSPSPVDLCQLRVVCSRNEFGCRISSWCPRRTEELLGLENPHILYHRYCEQRARFPINIYELVPCSKHRFSFISKMKKTKVLEEEIACSWLCLLTAPSLRPRCLTPSFAMHPPQGESSGISPSDYCRLDLHPGPHLCHSSVVPPAWKERRKGEHGLQSRYSTEVFPTMMKTGCFCPCTNARPSRLRHAAHCFRLQ